MRSRRVRSTPDVYFGLEDPTVAEWAAWHRAMLEERAATLASANVEPDPYRDRTTDWSDATFRQFFLFMYDESFFDRASGRYRTGELVADWRAKFGRVDSVLLWHAYPRLGFDERTQFDFYRDMPGGLARLRREVSDVLHAEGIRVFVDYNPWDAGSYDELGEIVAALDADGVMLDTMTEAPERLARAVELRRAGVVFAPELRPRDADLGQLRQSWAQWIDLGERVGADPRREPSIHRLRWLVPRHRQFVIRRWDRSRKDDIVDSFFNGAGLLLWDNVFGSWNPYTAADRRLIAETAAVLDRCGDLFVQGRWSPLVPTGVVGLDANRWSEGGEGAERAGPGRSVLVLRNRRVEPVVYRVAESAVAIWGERDEIRAGEVIAIEPGGVQALVVDVSGAAETRDHARRLGERAAATRPEYERDRPHPRRRAPSMSRVDPARRRAPHHAMIAIPGGELVMTVRHERRECGCYPEGATEAILGGWFYKDVVIHEIPVTIEPFAIRRTAVQNGEFLAFVQAAGYRPRDPEHFLEHLRTSAGDLPRELLPALAALPVTYVSLDDARAFAAAHGERLPTEAEWQWVAEGAGAGNLFPWGDALDAGGDPGPGGKIQPADDARGRATPQGVTGLSGNCWELTESEHSDGHTRFVILRGGVFLPPGTSEWLVARGARPNDSHAKYLLLEDGLDRSAAVSFRTVRAATSR